MFYGQMIITGCFSDFIFVIARGSFLRKTPDGFIMLKRLGGFEGAVGPDARYRQMMTRAFLFIGILLLTAGCGPAEVLVGFLGPLTGTSATLGVQGRNGLELAVSEWNSRGGIKGRKVRIIVMDDQSSPGKAALSMQNLFSKGVRLVIGPMTSSALSGVYDFCQSNHVLLVSPTVSSPDYSGKDDFFIRTTTPNLNQAEAIAAHSLRGGRRSMLVVADSNNMAYARGIIDRLGALLTNAGAGIAGVYYYGGGPERRWSALKEYLASSTYDSITVISSPIDGGMVCQQLLMAGNRYPVYSAAWGLGQDFIRTGGRAAEGVVFASIYINFSTAHEYTNFTARYRKRFNEGPDFPAAHAYEAATVLFRALLKAGPGNVSAVKSAILGVSEYRGLQGRIILDRYGDAEREIFLSVISNGKFVLYEGP